MPMTLPDWKRNGWLRPYKTTAEEVSELLAVIKRDLRESAKTSVDGDWRFSMAYNAALQCAYLALKASGYDVPKGGGYHQRAIDALKFTLNSDAQTIELLQAFRAKRGGGMYERIGIASDSEIRELRELATALHGNVLKWIKSQHPDLAP